MKIDNKVTVSYAQLPDGYKEFPQAVPPTAVGKGKKRLTRCGTCGWVEGGPVLEPSNTAWPNDGNRQPKTLHRCRRCNKVLATTGDTMGGRMQ